MHRVFVKVLKQGAPAPEPVSKKVPDHE